MWRLNDVNANAVEGGNNKENGNEIEIEIDNDSNDNENYRNKNDNSNTNPTISTNPIIALFILAFKPLIIHYLK